MSEQQQQIAEGDGGGRPLEPVTPGPAPPPTAAVPPAVAGPQAPAPAPAYPNTHEAMKQHNDHPLRMKLEWEEIYKAEEIRDTIQSTAELDDLSDFWYVQYALICKDGQGDLMMEDAMERAQALQVFRNQYNIVESYEEGQRALRRFVTLGPNYVLSFFYDPLTGNYTVIHNLANMDVENFTPDDDRDFMVGYYYFMLSLCPDFHSIHRGPSIKVECKDMGWSKRRNLFQLQKAASECLSFIPFDVCSVEFYNIGVGGAAFSALLKPILKILTEPLGERWPAHKKFHFGFNYLDGLDSVFLVPDAATAQQGALQKMEENLRLRFENERKFSLSGLPCEDMSPFTDAEVEAVVEARVVR